MSIQKKFLFSITVVITLFAFVVAISAAVQSKKEIERRVQNQKDETAKELMNILSITDSLVLERVKSSMKLLKQRGLALGTPKQQGLVTVNQTNTSQLFLGNNAQANNFQLVDELTSVMGGTATLFSKTGSDYIRISTNVIKNGNRAIGTKLAPTGKAITKIENGEAYYGEVDILGNPYLTGYEPMRNSNNETIGIWYVGYSADLNVLKDAIHNSTILKNGFVALQDGKDTLLMHSQNIDTASAQSIISGEKEGWAIQTVTYDQWGYKLILVSSDNEQSTMIMTAIGSLIFKIVVASILILITVFMLIRYLVGKPLVEFTQVVANLSSGEGDLTFRFDANRSDEFGLMASTFNKLLAQLQETLSDVNITTEAILLSSDKLKQTSAHAEKSVSELDVESKAINTAIKSVTQNSQAVRDIINKATDAATEADTDTQNSVSVLSTTINDIESQAKNLDTSMETITELAESSEAISGVMEVIRTIADQTNLLALNAAIEAARAGEQGRGFAVVADEVRSLASRTQTSTAEIHTMIERLQSGSREASEQMQHNKDVAFSTVETTQNAGVSLNKALVAVNSITNLNKEATLIAQKQKQLTSNVFERLESIENLGKNNKHNASQVAENCTQLTEQILTMKAKLTRYKF